MTLRLTRVVIRVIRDCNKEGVMSTIKSLFRPNTVAIYNEINWSNEASVFNAVPFAGGLE